MPEGGTSTAQLVKGQLLADYEIVSMAGEGGMGLVYRATQRSLNRTVALKVIREEIAQAPEYHDRFLREARLAASVDHPNVVSVYDVGEEGGHLWLAMQWIDGKDLRSLIATYGPRLPDRAVTITCQIASALDAVHAAGLVHRDVKPANVLVRDVDNKDHAYLTDFGVAKPPDHGADQLTRTGSLVGTTGYLSPEQIRGSDPGPRSDLYALGCVFFETLTGRPPFTGDNELAIRWAHANDPRPTASGIRPDLGPRYDAFIARALAVDPKDRFKSGREFGEALQAAHSGETTGVLPPGVPHVPTAIGLPTPMPPGATPLPSTGAYPVYMTPPPPYPQQPSRGGSPLALILLGLVAIAGIAVGGLAAAGVFSSKTASTQTITSTRAANTTPRKGSGPGKRKRKAPGAKGAPPSLTSCGGDLSVGPVTSCPFGQAVESAYDSSSGGTTDVRAYSPVTNQWYVMHCTGGTPHVCSGGNHATVYFNSGPGSSPTPSTTPPVTPSPSPGTTACDQNISVNSVTTCPFAQNVFKSYAQNYQANGEQSNVTIPATSPVTGKSYNMDCGTDGTTVNCSGGNNAFVTFPMRAVQVY
jgi:serine/threonine protein kinase